MKYYLQVLLIGCVVTSLWVSPVRGQDLGGLESLVTGSPRGDGPGTVALLILKGLGLTTDQKQQVHAILVAHRENLETAFRELQDAQSTLSRTLFAAEEIGAADLAPHADRVTQLRQQLLQEGLQVVLEIRQVLTPEQRAKAARLRDQLQTLQGALAAPPQDQPKNKK